MRDVFGILLMFVGVATGRGFQDPVVCRFTESNQCNVALGQRLHLEIPLNDIDLFHLKSTDSTNTTRSIIRYRISQNPPVIPARWQFINDNKTMILTGAERSDSGTYTLELFKNGINKSRYTLQVITEAKVSSVNVWYSCLFPEVRKVYCSSDGDNLLFTWTSESTPLRLEHGNSTFVLDKNHNGNVTCHVKNHISHSSGSVDLHTCPNYPLIILSMIAVLLAVLAVLAFYIYKKRQGLSNKEVPAQDDKELVYAQITNLPTTRTDTRPDPANDKSTVYATLAMSPSQRNQKDEVQYGELVFNTPARVKSEKPKAQEECVYSQVQHGQPGTHILP